MERNEREKRPTASQDEISDKSYLFDKEHSKLVKIVTSSISEYDTDYLNESDSYGNNPIRSMVRSIVIRYPLILGTSLERISNRIQVMNEYGAEWSQLLTILRRSDAAHDKWIQKQSLSNL